MLPVNYRQLKSYGGTSLESKFNDLVDAVQTNALNNGVGYSVAASPNGSYLKLSPSVAKPHYYPFQVMDATTISGGSPTYNVNVYYGQVLTAVNTSGQCLITPNGDGDPSTANFISGVMKIPIPDAGVIELQVTTDAGTFQVNPDTAMPTLSFEASASSNTATFAALDIATVNPVANPGFTGVQITQAMYGVIGYINALGTPVWY